jgi:sorting nexin-1/2
MRRELADVQAERRGVDAHSDFDAVSRLVKIEFARFDVERMEDFKGMLERYLDGMIGRQKEVSSTQVRQRSPF